MAVDTTVTIGGIPYPLARPPGGLQGIVTQLADINLGLLAGGVAILQPAVAAPSNSGEVWNVQSAKSISGGSGATWNALHVYPNTLTVKNATSQDLGMFVIDRPKIVGGGAFGNVATLIIAGPPSVPAGVTADPQSVMIQSGNLQLTTGGLEFGPADAATLADASDLGTALVAFDGRNLNFSVNGGSFVTFGLDQTTQINDLERRFRLLLGRFVQLFGFVSGMPNECVVALGQR